MHICTSYCVQYLHLPTRLLCKGMPYERVSLLSLPAMWEVPAPLWKPHTLPAGLLVDIC